MKKNPSLRHHIILHILGLTALVALIYGVLLHTYLIKGMDSSLELHLKLVAVKFDQDYQKNKRTPLYNYWPISSYIGLKSLPEKFRNFLPDNPQKHTKLFYNEAVPRNPENDQGDFWMIMPYKLHTGEILYVTMISPEEVDFPALSRRIDMLFFLAVPIGIVVVLIFFFVLRYIMKSLYKPIEELNSWADGLDVNNLNTAIPDFKYREINHLASLLHRSVKSLFDTLEREQRFLRNASHELRTPVAVIQSNIELVDRLSPDLKGPAMQAFGRIKRSTINMKRIIETLLWLGREEESMPDKEPVALDVLAQELVEENRYLLEGKNVEVELDIRPTLVHGVAHTVRIVVGNLIRNGFQYTSEGKVCISVADNGVTVVNENRSNMQTDHTGSEYGYGLGLILVEEITKKSGWHYENLPMPGGRSACVRFM